MKKQLIAFLLSACCTLTVWFAPPAEAGAGKSPVADVPQVVPVVRGEGVSAPGGAARAVPVFLAGGEAAGDPMPERVPAEDNAGTSPEAELPFALPVFPGEALPAAISLGGQVLPDGLCAVIGREAVLSLDAFEFFAGCAGQISAVPGEAWIECGGRVIPCSPVSLDVTVLDCGGAICVPVGALASAAGLTAVIAAASGGTEVRLDGEVCFPSAGEVYAEEDLYWLSRIISAEARGESFLGQLAVGSVVMNRARSRKFPDTVTGVIFDKQYGVQFSPAYSGSINREPTASCVRAAKLTLEGFSVSGSILFFFNSSIAPGQWITANRSYTFTIGGHDFYS